MEKVYFADCASYGEQDIHTAMQLLLERMEFEVPEGKTVLLKPNLLAQNRPEQHSITHYMVIDALCSFLASRKCTILIGDSIAFYQKGLTRKAFKTARFDRVAEKYGAQLVPFEECKLVKVTEKSTVFPELYIPEVLLKTDYIINVPKLKTHMALRLTGAVKNIYGVLPGGYKQKIHIWTCNDFKTSDVFLDLHAILKPCLHIMDAVYALDGGPTAAGKPVLLHTILGAENAAALDVVACSMIGYDPGDISTLQQAVKRGFIKNYQDVQTISCTGGTLPATVFKKLIKGSFILYRKPDMIVTDTYVYPCVKKRLCTCCSECRDFCPVGAITAGPGKLPEFDFSKCIHCYYCLSACKKRAIKTRSTFINKIIQAGRFLTGL